MKKAFVFILIISCIFTYGCTKKPEKESSLSSKASTEAASQDNKNSSASTEGSGSAGKNSREGIVNDFFFKGEVAQESYKGKFFFGTMEEKKVKLDIIKVAVIKYGTLYRLKLEETEGVPNDRLILGYFYVQQDKIYKINPTQENLEELKVRGEVPEGSVLVCQQEQAKDILGEKEKGLHQYITAEGDKREYHSYNNQTETGYYEELIWERNKGLVGYKSGYGAEKEAMELQINS